MPNNLDAQPPHRPWNKGRLVGQKPALKLKEIWSIRIRLQISAEARDLAMFNLAIDSKLRACDLISLRVDDVAMGSQIRSKGCGDATKDRAPGAIRDHRANPRICVGADTPPRSQHRRSTMRPEDQPIIEMLARGEAVYG